MGCEKAKGNESENAPSSHFRPCQMQFNFHLTRGRTCVTKLAKLEKSVTFEVQNLKKVTPTELIPTIFQIIGEYEIFP